MGLEKNTLYVSERRLSAKSGRSRTNNDGCLVFIRIKLLQKIHLLFPLYLTHTHSRRAAIQFGLLLLDVCFLALNTQNIFIAILLQVLQTKCIYSNATNNFLFSSIRNRRRRCCVVIFIMSLLLQSGICATHHYVTIRAILTSFGNTIVALPLSSFFKIQLLRMRLHFYYISVAMQCSHFPDFFCTIKRKIMGIVFEIYLKVCVSFFQFLLLYFNQN